MTIKDLLLLNANPEGCNQYKSCDGGGEIGKHRPEDISTDGTKAKAVHQLAGMKPDEYRSFTKLIPTEARDRLRKEIAKYHQAPSNKRAKAIKRTIGKAIKKLSDDGITL